MDHPSPPPAVPIPPSQDPLYVLFLILMGLGLLVHMTGCAGSAAEDWNATPSPSD